MSKFNERFRKLKDESELSSKELAQELGVAPSTLSYYLKDREPNYDILIKIADYFAAVSGYKVEETPLASGYAGYKDWFIMYYNRPGFTIEAGLGTNPLPISDFDRIYEDNKGILLGGMTQI